MFCLFRSGSRIAVCAAGLLLSPAITVAQNTDAGCGTEASHPSDVSVHLALKNGQTVFREGEIITLTEEFTADEEKKYTVNTASYDRSGRLRDTEVFCIEPERAVDPLADYFTSLRGFIGGGLFGMQELTAKPYGIDLELNEWNSLPPGSYRLSIVSNRVSVPTKEDELGVISPRVPLRSDTVEFTVVTADPGWQAAQLAAATRALDSPDTSDEEKHRAARVLRFLGSEAATRELARRYTSGEQAFGWDMKFGLYGSPHRHLAIEDMKQALNDPQHAVTREFVDALVTLEMQADPKDRLPKFDEKNREAFERARHVYDDEFERRTAAYLAQAVASIDAKSQEARALSVSELLQSEAPRTPEARARLVRTLVSSWSALPGRTQAELIRYRWNEVGGAEWLPVLESIVAGPPASFRELDRPDRATALNRIDALSPERGRELTMAEILDPKGDIEIDVLGKLPERELPQVEAPLLRKLLTGRAPDAAFQVLDRYASAQALPQLKTDYESLQGRWACVPQTAMLRYFLRTDPEYGLKQVAASLSSTATGCRETLSRLKDYVRMPRVEQLAIAALNDPTLAVAREAAEALEHWGSAKAEPALWARLEAFHKQWKDRPDELSPGRGGKINYEAGFEQVLVQAITNGQAWMIDAAAIRRLKELTSPHIQLDPMLEELSKPERSVSLIWWPPADEMEFSLGWYSGKGMAAFKEKLAQFPAGTHFDLVTTRAEREAHRSAFDEAADAASASGMMLDIQAAR